MLGYFLINNSLSQMIYYTIFFAKEFKEVQIPFLIHRILLIPILLTIFVMFSYLKRIKRHIFVFILGISGIIYLISYPQRIGRLLDYLYDPIFYVQIIIFVLPIIVIANYIITNNKTVTNKNNFMYSIMGLFIFFSINSAGYSYAILSLSSLFLFPLIVLTFDKNYIFHKKYRIKFSYVMILLILFMSLPLIYNPFSNYIPSLGMYRVNTFNKSLPNSSAKYIKFNSEEKDEILTISNYVSKETLGKDNILCFPYCPMIYVLTQKSGATYYGIFGLSNDQNRIIKELKEKPPKLIVVIKQGNFILSPSLKINNLLNIYKYINAYYHRTLITQNFDVYKKYRINPDFGKTH